MKKEKKPDESLKLYLRAEKIDPNNLILSKNIIELHKEYEKYDLLIAYLQKIVEKEKSNSNFKFELIKAHVLANDLGKASNLMDDLIINVNDLREKEKYYEKLAQFIIDTNDNNTDKDYHFAEKFADQGLILNPNNHKLLSFRSISKFFNNDIKGSVNDAELARDLSPKSETVLINLASIYRHIGEYKKSELVLRDFYKIFPDKSSSNFMLAVNCLSQNKFEEGWKYYESRWYKNQGGPRDKPKPNFIKPEWKPEMGYNSILIWAEQGLGDQILHGTILPDFVKKFKRASLAVDPRLLEIFKLSFPQINVFSLFDEINQDFFDYHIPLTSIGQYQRNKIEDFFPLSHYYKNHHNISKDPITNENLKCAISWKTVNGTHSSLKSSSLEALKPILSNDRINFYSIQYSDESEEIQKFYDMYGIKINSPLNLDVKNDLIGLINFIDTCDFVISTSNTNVHLSGAIGKKTYLLLPTAAGRFWYWENNYQGKNLWYPSIEIFSQSEPYNWIEPVERLLNKLREDYDI